jgi:WD40 repeat protein
MSPTYLVERLPLLGEKMDSQGESKKLVDTNQRVIRTDPRILKIRAVTSVVNKVVLLVVFGTCFFSRNLINQANQQVVQFKNSTTVKEFNSLEKHSSLIYSRAVLTGHSSSLIHGITFSPDGRTLASAGRDETIKVWDLQSKKEIAILTGSNNDVGDVAFSPDGRTLAFTGRKGTIKLWDLQSKKEIATLTGYSRHVRKLVFSPDGQILASLAVTDGKTIELWKVPYQKESNHQPVPIVGDLFAKLWNMQNHNSIASFEGKPSTDISGFSPNGQTLAITNPDSGQIIMWDWRQNKKVISTLTGVNNWRSVTFSPDGKSVVVNGFNYESNNRQLSIWDVSSKKVIAILEDSCGERHQSVAFSPDSKMLAWSTIGGGNTTIGLWDVQNQRQRGSLLIGKAYTKDNLVFSPNGKMLALSTDNNITLAPIDSSDY